VKSRRLRSFQTKHGRPPHHQPNGTITKRRLRGNGIIFLYNLSSARSFPPRSKYRRRTGDIKFALGSSECRARRAKESPGINATTEPNRPYRRRGRARIVTVYIYIYI